MRRQNLKLHLCAAAIPALAVFILGCGSDKGGALDGIGGDGSGDAGGDDASEDSDASGDDDDDDDDDDDSDDSDDDDDDDDDDDPGVKFDIGDPEEGDPPGTGGEDCDVDLLFVIDNSGSMSDYQTALGLAFPSFADGMRQALPPKANAHVGVTSTEMGYSSSGNSSQNNGQCTFTGDGGADYRDFYVTPEEENTGRNGAQGRLYTPAGLAPYFDIDMEASDAEFQQLKDWFASAAAIGEGGSNIEMLTAPVGWVADTANNAANDGFIRDHGTVMVVFFMQDEPDQTPDQLDGGNGGAAMLERLVAAKSLCGGVDCIVAGGFTDADACNGTRPIRSFLDGLTRPLAIEQLPGAGDPQQMADEMTELLTTTLVEVIQEACESIDPPE